MNIWIKKHWATIRSPTTTQRQAKGIYGVGMVVTLGRDSGGVPWSTSSNIFSCAGYSGKDLFENSVTDSN